MLPMQLVVANFLFLAAQRTSVGNEGLNAVLAIVV